MAVWLEENAAPSGQSPFHSNQSQIPFCTSVTKIHHRLLVSRASRIFHVCHLVTRMHTRGKYGWLARLRVVYDGGLAEEVGDGASSPQPLSPITSLSQHSPQSYSPLPPPPPYSRAYSASSFPISSTFLIDDHFFTGHSLWNVIL